MKKLWDEPLTEGELELILYKWKRYLGSVSRAITNRRINKNIPYMG